MTKTGFLSILFVVVGVHVLVLKSKIKSTVHKPSPDAKVYRLLLSKTVVKKPPPVLPPEPLIKRVVLPNPKPFVKEKKKIIKKTGKKRVKRVKKEKIIKEKIQKEVVLKPKASDLKKVIKHFDSPAKIDTVTIKERYLNQIRREIREKLFYPKIAKKMRIEGKVEVFFIVHQNGTLSDIRVINSSKTILSKGALKTIRSLSLKAIPKALNEKKIEIKVPIEFKLMTKG